MLTQLSFLRLHPPRVCLSIEDAISQNRILGTSNAFVLANGAAAFTQTKVLWGDSARVDSRAYQVSVIFASV